MHDITNKSLVPLAEFITTAHDHINISKFLSTIRANLNENLVNMAKIIVTDQGWALINAILLSFNNCNVPNYLNWCYLILIKNTNEKKILDLMEIRVYNCSTHFLKNIIRKSKNVSIYKHVRKSFIFMFTLIQNSVTIKQVENYLVCIYCVLNKRFLDAQVLYSLHFLATEIRKRNCSSIDIDDQSYLPEQKERDKLFDLFLKESNIFISNDYNYNIKASSPFTKYFDDKVQTFMSSSSCDTNITLLNEYFSPELFQILHDQLHLIPFWSGVMIPTILNKTRLTNNPVENWFGHVKNNMKMRKVSTSEFVSVSYKQLLAKYYKHHFVEIKNEKRQCIINQIHEETWKDKKKTSKQNKGFYFDNNDIFKFKTFYKETYDALGEIENNDFKEAFKQYIQLDQNNSHIKSEDQNDFLIESESNSMIIEESPLELDDSSNIKDLEQESTIRFLEYFFFSSIQNKKFEQICSNLKAYKQNFQKIIKELRNKNEYPLYKDQTIENYFKRRLALDEDFFPIYSTGNGSCLYNSISILIFNDESLYFVIKLFSIFILTEYSSYFIHLLKYLGYNKDLATFIENTCRENEWGNDLNIISISILLNKKIFCYNETNNKETNVRVKFCINENEFNPLNIGLCHSHFFPIISTNKNMESSKILKEFDFLKEIQKVNIDLY